MIKQLAVSLRLFLLMTCVTGIIYPLIILGVAKLIAPDVFIHHEGQRVGARLIGQKFESRKYFQCRPSATNYQTLPSGASNLGPISKTLKNLVNERKAAIIKSDDLSVHDPIPAELLFASGSGLDPHISPATAHFQVARVAKSRKMNSKEEYEAVQNLIDQLTEKRQFGFLGTPVINVLELNLALDKLTGKAKINPKL